MGTTIGENPCAVDAAERTIVKSKFFIILLFLYSGRKVDCVSGSENENCAAAVAVALSTGKLAELIQLIRSIDGPSFIYRSTSEVPVLY